MSIFDKIFPHKCFIYGNKLIFTLGTSLLNKSGILKQDTNTLDYTKQIKDISKYYTNLSGVLLKYNDKIHKLNNPLERIVAKEDIDKYLSKAENYFKEIADLGRTPLKKGDKSNILSNYLKKEIESNKLNNADALKQFVEQYFKAYNISKSENSDSKTVEEAKNDMSALREAIVSIEPEFDDFIGNSENAEEATRRFTRSQRMQAIASKAAAAGQAILNAAISAGVTFLVSTAINAVISFVNCENVPYFVKFPCKAV